MFRPAWQQPAKDGYTVAINGRTWPAPMLRKAVAFKWCSVDTMKPKECQENVTHTITPSLAVWNIDTRQDGYMLSRCLHQLWYCHPTATAEAKTYQTRRRFTNLTLFSSCTCAKCSLSVLFVAGWRSIRCSFLLLYPICFKVQCAVGPEGHCCLPISLEHQRRHFTAWIFSLLDHSL